MRSVRLATCRGGAACRPLHDDGPAGIRDGNGAEKPVLAIGPGPMTSTPRRVLLGNPSAHLPDLQRSPNTSILTRSSSATKTVNAISSLTHSYPGCRCRCTCG